MDTWANRSEVHLKMTSQIPLQPPAETVGCIRLSGADKQGMDDVLGLVL